jgi:DNA-binding NarL/FixJ family response regulator
VVGADERLIEGTAELLRANGYYVVSATSAGAATDRLGSADCQFSAVFVLAEANDTSFQSWLRDVRAQWPHMKRIVQMAGCDSDDLPGELRALADLVVTSDLQPSAILQRLQDVLTQTP